VFTGKTIEGGGLVTHLGSSVLADVNTFNTFVGGGFLLPIETTVLTNGSPVPFEEAITEGRRRMASAALEAMTNRSGDLDEGGFLGAVDVAMAHQNGLHPLPAVLRRGDAVEIVEYKAFTPPDFVQAAPSTRRSATGRLIQDVSPGRIQNWKRALLDLSANNPLLKLPARDTVARAFVPPGALGKLEDYLHDGGVLRLAPPTEVTSEDHARGVQSIAQLEADELARRLFQHRVLFLTYGEDTHLTRLRGLARKARSSLEESGSTSLFAGIGLLKWELEGKPMESPLILAPVRLTGGTGRNKLFELSLDDSGTSTPNFCLLEKLDEVFEIKIPGLREPQQDGFGLDVDKALQAVREALLQRQLPFSVEEGMVLGNFQFSTFRIWKDVDDHWARFLEAPVVKHLVETYNQDFPAPDASKYPDVDLPQPADESQYEAVQAAIAGETFVLEGPPGTGKSQTTSLLVRWLRVSGFSSSLRSRRRWKWSSSALIRWGSARSRSTCTAVRASERRLRPRYVKHWRFKRRSTGWKSRRSERSCARPLGSWTAMPKRCIRLTTWVIRCGPPDSACSLQATGLLSTSSSRASRSARNN